WLEVHEKMHHLIAEVLVEQGILKCSPESAFEQQLTDVFFPHGIGHLLGLQTHDVGGQSNEEGGEVAPPERYPSLRLTRNLDARMVVTVEPGLYFIPILLDNIRGHKDVSWSKVGDMLPYGGIRIEDNVYFDDDGSLVNLTRNAFNELDD
ncbi:MAG: M24 family metallopeptidase, partial [Gammaproteobacteria bacterium]|nr:M24 family metallopeptidase [Gammaproteobacteria bacterium]